MAVFVYYYLPSMALKKQGGRYEKACMSGSGVRVLPGGIAYRVCRPGRRDIGSRKRGIRTT